MKTIRNKSEAPTIGILGWEDGPENTLRQLEHIPGNIAHSDTFSFPVLTVVPQTSFSSHTSRISVFL